MKCLENNIITIPVLTKIKRKDRDTIHILYTLVLVSDKRTEYIESVEQTNSSDCSGNYRCRVSHVRCYHTRPLRHPHLTPQ